MKNQSLSLSLSLHLASAHWYQHDTPHPHVLQPTSLNTFTCPSHPALTPLPCIHFLFLLSAPPTFFSYILPTMERPSALPLLLLLLFLSCSRATANGDSSSTEFLAAECLSVPPSDFMGSLRTTIDAVRKVVSVVSQFSSFLGDFRLSNAVNDCLDLLDSSADELGWTLSASQNPNGKHNSSGDFSSDLQTWLSAAMVDQDTCVDGFEGTSGIVKSVVAGSLNQVTLRVEELLTNIRPTPGSRASGGGRGGGHPNWAGGLTKVDQFPSWVRADDGKLLQVNAVVADAVVAQDGSGNFTRIMDAVEAVPDYSMRRYVIYIKRGVYKENVEIKKKKWNIMMVGDGMNLTVISGNRNFIDGWTTFRSATFAVSGRGFMARDITFENTAGAEKHQAVALRSDSDLSVWYRCEIRGYQDSLYVHTMRQFFRECTISGTVDYIFGNAAVVFQNCSLRVKQGLPDQKNTITAQGRKDPNQPTGFSFQFCNITADTDLLPHVNLTQTYLGRPWKLYSRTIIMQSYISNVIRPEGWLEWSQDFALGTLYYAEYMNYGPAAGLGSRVKWPGYHVLNTSAQAANFTVAQFIEGNLWLPQTGVKFTSGLAE